MAMDDNANIVNLKERCDLRPTPAFRHLPPALSSSTAPTPLPEYVAPPEDEETVEETIERLTKAIEEYEEVRDLYPVRPTADIAPALAAIPIWKLMNTVDERSGVLTSMVLPTPQPQLADTAH